MAYAVIGLKALGTLSAEAVLTEIEAGFDAWARVSPFTFRRMATADEADFQVRIGQLDDAGETDNKLAHWDREGQEIVIDQSENWADLHRESDAVIGAQPLGVLVLLGKLIKAGLKGTKVDLRSVMIHEIGHLLNLDHSGAPDSVMAAKLEAGNVVVLNGRPIPATDVAALEAANRDLYAEIKRARGGIYWWPRERDARFQAVEVGLDQSVWAIDSTGTVYRIANQTDPATGKWVTRLAVSPPGQNFVRLAVLNENAVMGIDDQARVWQLEDAARKSWKMIRSARGDGNFVAMLDLAFSTDGTLYGVVPQTKAVVKWHYSPVTEDFALPYYGGAKDFLRTGGSPGHPIVAPKPVERMAVRRAGGLDEVWALAEDATVMRLRAGETSYTIVTQVPFLDVSAGADGALFGIDQGHGVWRSKPGQSPEQYGYDFLGDGSGGGRFSTIAAGDSRTVWGVDRDGVLLCSLGETE